MESTREVTGRIKRSERSLGETEGKVPPFLEAEEGGQNRGGGAGSKGAWMGEGH